MIRVATIVRTLSLCCLALTTMAFAGTANKTIVSHPTAFGVSRPVSELPIDFSIFPTHEAPEPKPLPMRYKTTVGPLLQEDPVLQKEALPAVSATIGVSFDGIPSPGYAPSDSNMAVGPNHVVETVNVQFAVYSKNGTLLAGPTNLLSLFTSLSGDCGSGTDGDPVVLYDRPADRWVLSIIGKGSGTSECIAVSKTNDPTGAYYVYGYSFGSNLNDYPKLSTWATASNSAYLATFNIFKNGQTFNGADLCGFDRTKMQAGDSSAALLCQMTPNSEGGYLPSDIDGPTTPADGTPGLFITWQNPSPGQLYLRKLTLDFTGGTATLSSPTTISVANETQACAGCIPQAGTTEQLDTLGDRMMYRFAIRHFADHDRAVVNHAVANGSQVAIRWYELYDPAGAITLNQQGTFAPDTTYRWMGSIAEDQNGDIGLGYSASSSSIHPAVRFTGRVPTDPLGTMETEASIVEGAGSQTTGLARWGDYTAMQVDPSDDCTFWFVDQYEKVSGTFNWHTSIASFAFNSCSSGPSFNLSASPNTVTVAQGNQGTSTITVTPLNGFTGSVTLSASGLPSGVTAGFDTNPTTSTSTLTLTASATAATGTSTVTITGVSGALTETTTLKLTVTGISPSFTLSALPSSVTVSKGETAQSTITITPQNGFGGNVTLSVSGLPKNVTASFSPNPATSTSTLTFTAASTAKVLTATVVVTGTSGSLTATTNITLTVKTVGNFSLTASPKTLTVHRSNTNSSVITVVPIGGFSDSVTLSATGLPSGVTASFSPNPTTSTSTVTFTASATAKTGLASVIITGHSPTLSKTVTIKLTVSP